jgi:hypothetical protein
MEEKGIYDNSGLNQNQPTTTESGAGGSHAAETSQGDNKRGPINTSPSIGHTIAGRSLDGQGSTEPGVEPGQEESGGGIDMKRHPHLDHE